MSQRFTDGDWDMAQDMREAADAYQMEQEQLQQDEEYLFQLRRWLEKQERLTSPAD